MRAHHFPTFRSLLALGVTAMAGVALPLAAAGASPSPASPSSPSSAPSPSSASSSLVFVNVNDAAANAVAVFQPSRTGGLSYLASFATGGQGGAEQGAVVDKLASEDSVAFDARHHLVLAVNAGSNTLSVFRLHGDALTLLQTLPTGGEFPTSVTVSGSVAYVLNAGGAGSISGFRWDGGQLVPIAGSTVSLGLANTNPPNFLMAPGEIAFSPDGSELVVTTKASTSDYLTYHVDSDGRPWAAPVVTASQAPVPFAVVFQGDELVAAEAGSSAVSTYALDSNGTLGALSTLTDGQKALCWIAEWGNDVYVANAGSATISAYQLGNGGSLTLIGSTGVVGNTGAGAIDLTVVPGTNLLYAESGATGTVDGFTINANGTLNSGGSTVVPDGANLEGIAAS
jgi:6-phosphogluconolactonase (cycloisomerase 2 family)